MDSDLDIIDKACHPFPFIDIDDDEWPKLTEVQQQFISIMIISGQVFSGGFHAVYYNNCARYMPLALRGLERIGAEAEADIVRMVVRVMESDPWAGPPETWPNPDQQEPPPGAGDIGEYDDPWYALDMIAMWRRMATFITAHPDQFAPLST